METPNLDKLDNLIDQREREDKHEIVGIFYVLWGLVASLGMLVYGYVWHDGLLWVFWLPSGVLIQTAVVVVLRRQFGRSLWTHMIIPTLWSFTLLCLPFVSYVFPDVLHLYKEELISPIISAWIASTSFAAGIFSRRGWLMFSALIYLIGGVFFFFFPGDYILIFVVQNTVGLTIPGIGLWYEERR